MAAIKKAGGAAGIVCSVAAIIAIVLGNGHVRTNERGLELIGNAESCRRDPYVCPAGFLTDGMGNTHGVKRGTIKNDQQIAVEWEENILTLNPALIVMAMVETCLTIRLALPCRLPFVPDAAICGDRRCSLCSEAVT